MGLNSYRNCILYTFVKQQVECVAICDTVFMVCVWRLVDMAVTKTANMNVRIQENIKQQAEQILETIGVPRATAIDMFYRQIILNNGIPFSLTIPRIPSRHIFYNKYFAKRINIRRNGFLTNWLSFVPTIGGILVRRLALFRNVVVGLNIKRFSLWRI